MAPETSMPPPPQSEGESFRTVLKQTIGTASDPNPRSLCLMMLGCEDNPPYGPTEHTGQLFMDLICKCLQELFPTCFWHVAISIYRVKQLDYPSSQEEWDSYDGIILPGSFSAAYSNESWIETLKQVIQQDVYGRPTLGVCFGHQLFAHTFEDGEAIKCPAGVQAGRQTFSLTQAWCSLPNQTKSVELYCTHGDMVKKLPSCAVSLGGNEKVPIQAAAYFQDNTTRPVAITFQAHPEYASPQLGLRKTLGAILDAMVTRGVLTLEEQEAARKDAVEHYAAVERDSLHVMKTAGILLGWFPATE